MNATNSVHRWSKILATDLSMEGCFGNLDDLAQDVAMFLCERTDLLDQCAQSNVAYVKASVRNWLIDRGNGRDIDAPRMRASDSDLTKSLKLSVMNAQVSLNDESGDGLDYETIIPCGKYEQAGLWKKIRNTRVSDWIEENAPLLDFLLEIDKANTYAPSVWNSKSLVRAYMGADEVRKLLKVFGGALTPDERLSIEENLFNKFLHAKKARLVKAETSEADDPDFFLAM